MRKLLKKYGFVPDKLITDELRSYAAAAGHLGIAKRHERGRWRNNRAENSHQPTRRRERKMQGFKSVGSAQRFLSVHAAAQNTFNVQRHLTSARTHRAFRASAMSSLRRERFVACTILQCDRAHDRLAPVRRRLPPQPVILESQNATAWPMAQQSSGEFASANPTKGEEDARVQECGIRAKISLNPRSHL
jgi:DDE domain